mgnify:CR=1 FL=1
MLEKTILSNLILNEDFGRKVYPYLKDEYFDDLVLRKVFETASEYLDKYKEPPSIEALKIAVDGGDPNNINKVLSKILEDPKFVPKD